MHRFTQLFLSSLVILFMVASLQGQTTLSVGDIAFTGFTADGTDQWSFILLTDVESGTEIRFTDNGWLSTGSFRSGEGTRVAMFTTDVDCGTEIFATVSSTTITSPSGVVGTVAGVSGSMNFSASGDQIFAYQGTDASPSFISAVNWDGAGGPWNSTATSSNTTGLPAALTNGINAVGHGEVDNGSYFCSNTISGTIAAMRTALNTTTNWTKANSPTVPDIAVPSGCNYTLSDCASTDPICPGPGDLVITEVMQNPAIIGDNAGEYFEIYNAADAPVELEGLRIEDNDFDDFVVMGSHIVAPGGYFVFANSADATMETDYIYGTQMFLANGSDELVLVATCGEGEEEIDRVEWDNGATFPDPNGASMQLDPNNLADDNNDGSNWCESSSFYTTNTGVINLGTPGEANVDCGGPVSCSLSDLVITQEAICNEESVDFSVQFAVSLGSGEYQVVNADDGTVYGEFLFGGANGAYFLEGKIPNPVAAGTINIKVISLEEEGSCETDPVALSVPDCPMFEPDPTELCLGDIALTGFEADGADQFAFYLLKDVGFTTQISFTDHGWFSSGSFRATEGVLTLTFNRPLACGTAVAVDVASLTASTTGGQIVGTLESVDNGFALSTSGDQIFAFQGDLPTESDLSGFLAAIHFNGSGWEANATSSTTSALPCVFEEGVTSYGFSEADNGIFNCVEFETSYTPSALRALIYDPANWSFSGSPVYTYPPDCFIGCSECTQPTIESTSADANGDCPADGITLTVSGDLGDAAEWVWYSDCCGGGEIVGMGTSLTVFPEENTTYYVRGEGGCVDAAKCEAVPVEAIVDDVRPTISCGGLDRVEVAPDDACAVTIDLEVPEADDNCGLQSLKWRFREILDEIPGPWSSFMNNPNNRTFAVGSYEIQWRAKDASGNKRRCKYTLDVLDETDPEVTCTDITIEFNGQNIITWDLEEVGAANDACGIDDLSMDLNFATCDQIDEVLAVEVTAVDVNGNDNSCIAYVTVDGLPCGWFTEEEMVDCEGEADYTAATETFILSSEDCHNPSANASDEFAFIQTELCGNAEIIAQVTSISGNAFGWAGVTMRESNDPGSKSVSLLTNLGTNHRTEVRYTENGTTQFFGSPAMGRHWLKINRLGNQFRLFASFDGVIWFLKSAVSVGMDDCLQVGLVLNSFVGSGDMTATFDNVSVSGSTPNLGLQATDVQTEDMLNTDRKTRLNPSISSSTAKETFTAFPNPTAGAVTLTIGGFAEERAQLLVLDSYGRQVQQRDLGVIEEGTIPMDLSTLPAGVYTIQLQLANGMTHQQRVILQPRP